MIQINIPMPNNCYDCPFSDDSGDYPYCFALHQNRGYTFDRRTKRFPNCPLKLVEEQKEDIETDRLKNMCRCKDCKQSGIDTTSYPKYWCSAHTEYHDGEWFCADGERKDS